MYREAIEREIAKALKERYEVYSHRSNELDRIIKDLNFYSNELSEFVSEHFKEVSDIKPKIRGGENGFEVVKKGDSSSFIVKFSTEEYSRDSEFKNSDRRIAETALLSCYGGGIAIVPEIYVFSNELNSGEKISISVSKKVSKECMNLTNYFKTYEGDEIIPENFVKIAIKSIFLEACDVRADNIVVDITDRKNPKAFLVDILLPEYRNDFKVIDISYMFKLLNIADDYFKYKSFGSEEFKGQIRDFAFAKDNPFWKKLEYLFLFTQGVTVNSKLLEPTAIAEPNKTTKRMFFRSFCDGNDKESEAYLKRTIDEVAIELLRNYNSVLKQKNGENKKRIFLKFCEQKEKYLKKALNNVLLFDMLCEHNFNCRVLRTKVAKIIYEKIGGIRLSNDLVKDEEDRILDTSRGKDLRKILEKYNSSTLKVMQEYKESIFMDNIKVNFGKGRDGESLWL